MAKNVNPYFYREFLEQLSNDIGNSCGSDNRRRRRARQQEMKNSYSPADAATAADSVNNGDAISLVRFENDGGAAAAGDRSTVEADTLPMKA